MERKGFGQRGDEDDDLDSLQPKATDHKPLATATSAGTARAMRFGLERADGSKMRSSGDSGGAERISGGSSNQAKMIVAEGEEDGTRGRRQRRRRMDGNNNDNDHSFEPSQTATMARSQQTTRQQQQQQPTNADQSEWHEDGIEMEMETETTQEAPPSSGAAIDQEGLLLLLGKRNEWSCMMQQIVESGESKLMRHRRVVERHQQRQLQQPEQQQQQQRGALDPAGMVQHQDELVASGQLGDILNDGGGQHEMARVHSLLARVNAKAMLLKSPAFASNTLDDAELDKLATSKRPHPAPHLAPQEQQQQLDQDLDSNEMGRGTNSAALVISGSAGATSTAGAHSIERAKDTLSHGAQKQPRRHHHHEQKTVTDSDENSSANMINRRNVGIHGDKQWQDCSCSTKSDQGTTRGATVDKRPFWDNSLDGSDVVMGTKQVASHSTSSMETTNASDNDEQQEVAAARSSISSGRRMAPDEPGCRHCHWRQDQEDRGGPTPTNDLIRTLIHRDRLALMVGSGKKQQQQLNVGSPPRPLEDSGAVARATTKTRGPSSSSSASSSSPSSGSAPTSSSLSSGQSVARTDCGMSGCLQAHRVVSGTGNINEVQTTMIRTEMVHTAPPEANLTIGAAHNNDTIAACHKHCCVHCKTFAGHHHHQEPATGKGSGQLPGWDDCSPPASNNKSERRNDDKCVASSCSHNHQAIAKQTPSPPSSQQVSLLPELSPGLSTTTTTTTTTSLIGSKCHEGHLQLSPPEVGQSSVVGKAGSQHQQPYQVTSHHHLTHSPQTPNARLMVNEPPLSRPVCAYKFPLLLNHGPSGSEYEDDDDGDDGTDDDDEEYDATYKSLAGSHLFDDINTMSTSSSRLPRADNSTLTDQLGQSLLNSCRLRPSVSSPSALSTPTNESGGCGDVCCSRQAQLSKLASENSQLIMVDETKLTPSTLCTTTSANNNKQHGSSTRKVSLSGLEAEQSSSLLHEFPPAGGGQRKRMGSNPLDRLRLVGGIGHRVGHWDSSSSQTQTNSISLSSSSPSSGYSSKRHSIISALTGGNRLSHPRSFFSGGQHQHAAKQMANPPDQRLESLEHHYDPLIPESGFKIVVMGTSGSGKTSIIQRFMYDSFSWRHNPTVEDTYFIEFPYMKNMINISISDTSGTYQFPAMRRLAISSGDAFILVYSVDDPKSFDELEQLRQKILDEREQAYSEAASGGSIRSSLASGSSSNSVGPCQSGGCSQASSTASAAAAAAASASVVHKTITTNPKNILPDHQHLQQPIQRDLGSSSLSPARHWSLASIFSQHNQATGSQHHPIMAHNHSNQSNSLHSSVGSIATASSNSNSTDHSRRSSISAAEAALKTRRTRHPPMVIVANKYDLPVEKHRVNSDEIEALVEIDWNNGFVRASAALNLNIDDIFQQVLKQARQPPTLTAAIVSKRRKSLPPKLPQSIVSNPIL